MTDVSSDRQRALGTAQIVASALGVVAGLALAGLAFAEGQQRMALLGRPALFFLSTGVLYLLAAGGVGIRVGLALRRDTRGLGQAWSWFSSTHALVLMAVIVASLRGPASRALLANLDELLATLATASCLWWLLSLAVRWQSRKTLWDQPEDPQADDRKRWSAAVAVLIAALLLAGSLLYLETCPLPNTASMSSIPAMK